jgi:hypothetical protein
MMPNQNKAKVVTLEEFNQRGGGKPPESDNSLWEIFNDKVSDLTISLRKEAREQIRQELFLIEDKKKQATLNEQENKEITEKEKTHSKEFAQIVTGGLKGAYVAGKVLTRKLF